MAILLFEHMNILDPLYILDCFVKETGLMIAELYLQRIIKHIFMQLYTLLFELNIT